MTNGFMFWRRTAKQTRRSARRSGRLPLAAATAALLVQGCGPAAEVGAPATEQAAQQLGSSRAAAGLQRASEHLLSLRSGLGLTGEDGFAVRSAVGDDLGLTHLRFDQTFRGVKVWTGDVIVELSQESAPQAIISALHSGIAVSTTPALTQAHALAIAHRELRPQGPYAGAPTIELVVYPRMAERERASRLRGPTGELNAEDIEQYVASYHLAFHIHTALENGALETKHTDYMIDAHSGEVLKTWSTLYTASAAGTGLSEYSGSVSLNTATATGGFELRDTVRSMNIATYNANHGTGGMGTIYADADNNWGDGKNYTTGAPTTGDNGQTAGVDAHYGTEMTFDYYLNVHGRNGIDGAGKATYNVVHYSTSYDNAFWSDSCFCMTYGDGKSFKTLTSLDVAGHEMTHGVTSNTAKLVYSGESGGLNESMSDIHGTMVEFYARGGSGSTIGDTGGNFFIGDQLSAKPLRYMDKPSKDGKSPDAWKSGVGNMDVHYSSGPMNRAFYFLSQGASSTSTSDSYSSYLPAGMKGIGNDKAARIAFRALAVKMTASTNYAGARTAFLAAATDLYGATSDEYAAVEDAFGAINVGKPHGGGGGGTDTTAPTTKVTAPGLLATLKGTVTASASASDDVGVTKVEFYAGPNLIGTDTTSPYSITWDTTKTANNLYFFTSKAYDAAGNVGTSPNVLIRVNN
ncbi:MAG TPA: M4 family metallopeptidase [Pseudomonadota bacterium]|nr:M4 family metallopeptidase [Pseudomonadota bacterium]